MTLTLILSLFVVGSILFGLTRLSHSLTEIKSMENQRHEIGFYE